MIRVLEFCQSPSNPFEKLVRQEQLLHCTSIHAHLTNSRINVNVEVKTTIKQLNLYLENDVIRAKGRIIYSELPLDATTPLFLPNKSHLVDLLINHIHTSHHHVGLSQTLSLYRQRCWTPKICSCIESLLLRCVICQRVKKKTLPRPLPPPHQLNEYAGSPHSRMWEKTIRGASLYETRRVERSKHTSASSCVRLQEPCISRWWTTYQLHHLLCV